MNEENIKKKKSHTILNIFKGMGNKNTLLIEYKLIQPLLKTI